MSEKLTSIIVPGEREGSGLTDWGEKTAGEMISSYRAYAADLRARAEAIELTPDDGFLIEVVRGAHVRRRIRTIQDGRKALPA